MEVGQQNRDLKDMKIGMVIQARMGSERLPGKVMMPMPFPNGIPIIGRITESVSDVIPGAIVVVATSVNLENERIVEYCQCKDIACFRGNETDVLSRFIEIQNQFKFDHIVRLTGDNPVIDQSILHDFIDWHMANGFDYSSTEGMPIGMNHEIFKGRLLDNMQSKKLSDSDREHVTLYFRNSDVYSRGTYQIQGHYHEFRLTVDTPLDYLAISAITSYAEQIDLKGLPLIDHIILDKGWLLGINNMVYQKAPEGGLTKELEKAVKLLNQMGYKLASEILDQISPDQVNLMINGDNQ